MKLGSLFDGSGTCPLAAVLCGIEPAWASEIERFPVQVTTKRFPNMKHLGDITSINGAEVEPVDIITFGSPCQDLSVAGKRAGLDGERSNLFMEAIRIVREMREATNNEYPRYIMWENVPGAFSSNKGLDFRRVLEEITETSIPMPPGDRWAKAGMVELPDRQVAWRTLDAQYWGVPQRRKRIFLIADFRGQRAGEILFKPESMFGDTTQGREAWEGTSTGFEECIDTTNGITVINDQGGLSINIESNEISPTLRSEAHGNLPIVAGFLAGQGEKAKGIGYEEEICPTLRAGGTTPSIVKYPDIVGILCASGAGLNRPAGQGNESDLCIVQETYSMTTGNFAQICKEQSPTLLARDYKDAPIVYSFDSLASNSMKSSNPHSGCRAVDIAKTLDTSSQNPSKNQGGIAVLGFSPNNSTSAGGVTCEEEKVATLSTTKRVGVAFAEQDNVSYTPSSYGQYEEGVGTVRASGGDLGGGSENLTVDKYQFNGKTVRRLTPTECARLQGFPSWWCADIPHSDTAEYKMWGNGMALPCVLYIMQNIVAIND